MTAGGIVKMKFCEQLGKYIEQLSCTAKELCKLSGISPSTFSRYRSGERYLKIDTVAFDGLCNALEAVAREKGYGDMTRENIKRAFLDCEDIILPTESLCGKISIPLSQPLI